MLLAALAVHESLVLELTFFLSHTHSNTHHRTQSPIGLILVW